MVEQVIRPTGLVDPEVVIQPTKGQIDDLLARIDGAGRPGRPGARHDADQEDGRGPDRLPGRAGVRVQYLHSDIDTITRIEILRDLRLGEIDVLVGINLLREGLDLPEVSLVAILDADKEGFLRSASSLIQTMGRAARNVDGKVVLYADTITDSMRAAIGVTQRRRELQRPTTPSTASTRQTIRKAVTDILARLRLRPTIADRRGNSRDQGGRAAAEGRGRRMSGRTGVPGRGCRRGRVRLRDRASRGRSGRPAGSRAPTSCRASWRDAARAGIARAAARGGDATAAAELRFEEAALLRDELAELRLALAEAAEGTPDPRRYPDAAGSTPSGRERLRSDGRHARDRGARGEHNLQDVSLELPRDRLIVFTGLSGSGKSSLAFDTIYAEGQRRYVESLSAYARQFLGQMDKPDVDFIEGLSPAISIDQKSASRNPRSTVGTITEVYDYLRLLYARIGRPHCPICGRPVARQTPQQIVDRVLELPEGTRFQVLAPVVRGRKGEYDGAARRPGPPGIRPGAGGRRGRSSWPSAREVKLARYEQHTIEVVVDRLVRRDGIRQRLTESIETALGLAGGIAEVVVVGRGRRARRLASPSASTWPAPTAASASRSPRPATSPSTPPTGPARPAPAWAPVRGGSRAGGPRPRPVLGRRGPRAVGRGRSALLPALLGGGGRARRLLDRRRPGSKLRPRDRKLVLYGSGTAGPRPVPQPLGPPAVLPAHYEGIVPWLQRRHGESESDWSREQIEQYMREVPCPACGGARLKPESLAVTVGEVNIFELCSLSIAAATGRGRARWS